MDAVELPLPAPIVAHLMRSSGCGGGVTKVELLTSQTERETCGHGCNINGSSPAFRNNISDADLHRQASLGNEQASIDHDKGNIPNSMSQANQSQRKSGKVDRITCNSSRRSRVTHMETSLNAAGSFDTMDLGSYPEKCNISEKIQTAKQKTVSVKRNEKRNGKISKSKSDSFSVMAGLSSFSSAAGGNNIFGVYGSKQDICDVTKHVDELSLNELLDGSYKHPQSVKKVANLNANVLHLVREACSVLQLREFTQLPVIDSTYNLASSGSSTSHDIKGHTVDPSPYNKVDNSLSGLTDHPKNLEFLWVAPKDVMHRLALSPHKDLDLLLLDNTKPASKGNLDPRLGKPGLPTFPWSHISGGHFRTNPDVVKLTPNKSMCRGRWVKIQNSTTSFGNTTTFLAGLESLTYDQTLVPLGFKQPGASVTDTTFEMEATPSGVHTIASKTTDGHSPGVLVAAQTLCEIAARFQKPGQNAITRWPKKPSQKSMRATKLKSDEQLEKALFSIQNSTPLDNSADVATVHVMKRLDKPEAKHHNNEPLKRPFVTQTPTRLWNKPPKLRKVMPMEWTNPTDRKRYDFLMHK